MPTRKRPRAHRVLFERHRTDRFKASSVVIGWFPGNTVASTGRLVGAVQDAAYFQAFDVWWEAQPADRPAAERFNEFLRLYERGAVDR